jgi:hypothetical protein
MIIGEERFASSADISTVTFHPGSLTAFKAPSSTIENSSLKSIDVCVSAFDVNIDYQHKF